MGDSVKTIVDSIKKHIGFKRLAVYSIQSLCKKCTPPSNGWQQNAIEAFEAGATEAIAEVVAKNSSDGELFLQALVQLQACAVSGSAMGVLSNGSIANIVGAFGKYFAEAKIPSASEAVRDGLIVGGVYRASGKDAEAVAVTESFVRLLAYIALQARAEAATSQAGIVKCLLDLLPRLPTPGSVRLALTALEAIGRSTAGSAVLCSAGPIQTLLAAASQLFGVEVAGAAAGAATPSRSQRVANASARGPASPTAGGSGLSRRALALLNGHLDPAFKLLDRLSRDDTGLKTLRASPAVSSLAVAVEWAQSATAPAGSSGGSAPSSRAGLQGLDPSVAATGVRLLARVLGNDLAALINRIATTTGTSPAALNEADFAASLLSSLATDPDVASRLVTGPGDLLKALVDLLGMQGGACTSHKVAAALSSAVRRVAAHSLEFGDALVAVGTVPRLMATARAMASVGGQTASASAALTEALTALADLLTTPDDVAAADNGGSGMAFFLSLLAERGPSDPGCAAACLAVLHACQCNGYDASNLAAGNIVKLTLAAMTSEPGQGHIDLQVVGTAVLSAASLGSRGAAGGPDGPSVSSIVSAGALAVAIGNLGLAVHAAPGPEAGNPGAMATGTATRLLTTSATYLGRPSMALAGNKATQRLSLHAAAQAEETTAVGEADGAAAAAAAAAGSHHSAPLLAAVSMHLLYLLCSGASDGSATASAKSSGLVRAMLDAYGRHSDSDAVHDAFTDLVECTVGEAELAAAVLAAAKDTALLQSVMAAVDPALLAIAEADLGKEGVLTTTAGGEVSISAADADDGAGAHESGASGKAAGGSKAAAPRAKELPGAIASRITDALCLLQSATCSARLSGILVRSQGVPVLVRVLGIVSVIKGKPDAGKGGAGKGGRGKAVVLQTGGGRAGADPEAERTIPQSVQDEILVRCCTTLTGMGRIAMDWRVGTLGLDPVPTSMSNATGLVADASAGGSPTAASSRSKAGLASGAGGAGAPGHRRQRSGKTVGDALSAMQATLASALYRPVVSRILIKTINARTNLPGSLSAASVCLGVLSMGRMGGGVAGPGETGALLDTIIAQGGVEAIVGGMRAHPACLPALQAVSNALGCVAIVGRALDEVRGTLRLPAPPETTGSAAVATRGATREIIRSLQNAAAAANGGGSRWYGPAGQAALCSLLRVLLVIAETPKGADILRKQGTLDALIATLDSGTAAADAGGDEKDGGAGGKTPAGSEKDPSSGGATVAAALSGDVFGGALSAVVDGQAGGKASAGGSAAAGGDAAGGAGASSMGGQGPEACELILGVLSSLMDSKDLAEAVRTINMTADKVAAGSLKMASIQLTRLALTTVYSLAGKDNGVKAGGALWTDALAAVTALVSSCAGAADALLSKAGTPEAAKLEVACRAAQVLLPAAANCLSAIVAFRSRLDLTGAADATAAPTGAPTEEGKAGAQAAADLPTRWSASVGQAVVSLVSCAQIAAGVRGAALRAAGASTPAALKSAVDRLSTSFSTSAVEIIVSANNMLQRDAAAGVAMLKAASAASGPVAGLVRVTARLTDEGESDRLAYALDLLYSVAKVQAPGGEDGLTAILGCEPPVAPILERALGELIATGGQGGASGAGCALLLLARLAHRQPTLTLTLREGGINEPMRQALQRFCAPPAAEEAAAAADSSIAVRDVEATGSARVLEGASLLQSVLFGHVGAGKDEAARTAAQEADIAMMNRLLTTVREEPGSAYAVQAPKAMTAVCELVAAACTVSGEPGAVMVISEEAATAAREACTALDARGLIVAAMSSARADSRLLKAGARALSALGGGSGSGCALEARRAVVYLRRAVGLPGVSGLLPEGDIAAGANETAAPLSPNAGSGLPSPSLTPSLVSPSVSGGAGKQGKEKTPGEALAAVESTIRNLSATLAGESTLTPAAYRYAFDTLVAAVDTATAAYAVAAAGGVTLTPVQTEARGAHHHGQGSAAAAGPQAVTGSSRASMRMSMAINRTHSTATSSVDGGRSSPEKDAQSSAAGGSLQTQEALQAAFLAQCSAVTATGVQGLSRLATPVLVSNPAAADHSGGASGAASTRPELAAALGLPSVATVWDATEEEVNRIGEPRGTSSHARTAAAHEAAAAAAKTAGKPWPAATVPTCPVAAPVTAAEIVDGLLLALGHRNTTLTAASSSSSPSAMAATRQEGYIVAPTVAESVSKAVSEMVAAAHKRTGGLIGSEAVNGSPRPEDGSVASDEGAEATAELTWAATARGLVHVLSTAQLSGQPATDNLALPVVTTPMAAGGADGPARERCSLALASGTGRYLREALACIISAASEPAVANRLALATLGSGSNGVVAGTPPSASAARGTPAGSPASVGSSKAGAVPPSPFGAKLGLAGLGFTAVPACGAMTATPITVLLQLMLGAEALTRPESAELARRLAEFQGPAASSPEAAAESGSDAFARSSALLQHMCSGEALRTLVKRIVRPDGVTVDASPAWLLLAQIADSAHSGGLTRLPPTSEWEDLTHPARAGSLACIRVTGEILEAMLAVCGPEHADSTAVSTADSVVVAAGLGQAAALFSTWAAAAVAAVDYADEQPAGPAIAAVTPAPRRAASVASVASAPGALGSAPRAPGSKPAISPLEHVAEEQGQEGQEGQDAEVQEQVMVGGQEPKTAPAGRRNVRSGVSFATDGDLGSAAGSTRLNPEELASLGVYRGAAQCVVFSSIRLLGHMDLGKTGKTVVSPVADPTPVSSSPGPVATPSGASASDLPSLLADDACLSLYRSSIRQAGADKLAVAGIQVLRRTLGLTAAHSAGKQPVPLSAAGMAQVEALAIGGVFLRVTLALGLHSSSRDYAREVIRLLDDTGRALAAQAKLPGGAYTGALLQGGLGLTGGCLKALQSTVKRLGKDGQDEFIRTVGDRLVSTLSDVFSSVSAKGFLEGIEKAVRAVEACSHMRVTRPEDGTVVYVSRPSGASAMSPSAPLPDASQGVAEAPEAFVAMLLRLEELQKVSTNLEPEAVPVVPAPLLGRVAAGMRAFSPDARVAGILAWALARSCENGGNHSEIIGGSGAADGLVELVRWHKADVFVAEAVASAFRPLSVQLGAVQVLKKKNVVPALVDLMAAHTGTMLPKRVSYDDASMGAASNSAAAKEARAKAYRALMKKLMSPVGSVGGPNMDSPEDAEGEKEAGAPNPAIATELEPRIAHYAVQSLANVACDNMADDFSTIPGFVAVQQHVDKGCAGGVARLVAAGGIAALVEVMKSHLERPRVLEDALCAMSNVAYSCDGVRLLIGRTAAPLVVSVLRVFNSDPRTFSMALRTVGNLTRCDENIVSVVSAGVIEGIVEGMERNKSDAEVLKLAADVVGNLASIDETAVDKRAGLQQLRSGLKARAEAAAATGASLPASAAARIAVGTSPRADRLANMTSLQDAVASLLLDDGAHTGLVDAMLTHATDAVVISACLRSLQYIADSQPLVERMQSEASLGKAVCQVMRSCDFDPELTVRGALLLAQMLRYEGSSARTAALDAGAAHVLLSAVETHRVNVDTFTQVLKVVQSTCADEPAVISAAKELDAPATVLKIMTEAGAALTGTGGRARAGAGAGGAGGTVARQAGSMRGVGLDDTLALVLPERALLIVRQGLLLLTTWASKDATVGEKMGVQAARTMTGILVPPAPEAVGNAPTTPYSDAPLLEATLGLLAPIAMASPASADALAKDGETLRLVAPLPCFMPAMDRPALATSAVDILQACGVASPAAALLVLEANGHGVAQGLAVHWALKQAVEEATRRGIYEKAGNAIKGMVDTSVTARKAKAEADRAAAAAAAAAGVAPEGSAASASASGAGEAGRDGRAEVASLTPRSRAKDDKRWAAAMQAREKEAAKLAQKMGLPIAAVLEERAGLIPWNLFPRSLIDKMAGAGIDAANGRPSDLPADVWFLPEMALEGATPKLKARRMRLTVSEDLRVLTWAYTSRRFNKVLDWNLPLSTVHDVRAGVPAPSSTSALKKPLVALRAPNPGRGIVLESDTSALLHLETAAGEEHDRVLRAMQVLVQYARARAGMREPLPELPAEPLPGAAGGPAAVVDFVGEGVASSAAAAAPPPVPMTLAGGTAGMAGGEGEGEGGAAAGKAAAGMTVDTSAAVVGAVPPAGSPAT